MTNRINKQQNQAAGTAPMRKATAPVAESVQPVYVPGETDRFLRSETDSVDKLNKVAQVKQAIEQALKHDPQAQSATTTAADPGMLRTPYTGGAPALNPEQMNQAAVQNNLILRTIYKFEDKAPWLLKGYQNFTRVLGPLGATAFFGLNVANTINYWKNPKTPMVLKVGMTGATALSGVSAVAAGRLGLHALNILPMAGGDAALKTLGGLAGKTAAGAGFILSAMDTFNTFRNPNSTAAQKGFSVLGTVASGGLLACMALNIAVPGLGLALGIAAVAAPFLKGFLAHNKIANAIFEGIGKGVGAVVDGVKKVGGAIVDGAKTVGHAIGSAAHAVGHFFSSL